MQSIERCTIKPWLSPAFIGVSIHQWRRLPSCLMILYNTSHPAARRPAKDELADRTEAWRQNSVQLRILHFYLLPSNKSYFIPFLLDSSLQRLYLKDDPPILQTLLDNAPNGLNGVKIWRIRRLSFPFDVKLDFGLLNLVISFTLGAMWSIIILDQNEIFIPF